MSQELTDGGLIEAEIEDSEDLARKSSVYTATALVILAWSVMLTLFFVIAMALTIVARSEDRGLRGRMDESRQGIDVIGVYAVISWGQFALAAVAALVLSFLTWRLVLTGIQDE